jgi:uncharacterized protein YdaT
MPFDMSSVNKHNKGLNLSQKKKWIRRANAIYRTCLADGGSDKTCAPKAIKIANASMSKEGRRIK